MKTNGTRRIVTFMLALVLVFTTVCVGTTEVEAAEKFTTIIAPTQTEQATAGTEVKTPFSLTKSYGFVAQIVTEAPVRRNAEPAKSAVLLIWEIKHSGRIILIRYHHLLPAGSMKKVCIIL